MSKTQQGTCRHCGAAFVLRYGFIPTHYDGKNVRCPGSRDVSLESSAANKLTVDGLWRRFSD